MKYLLVQGNAEELIQSINTFLDDDWVLHGSTFVTGREVLMQTEEEKKRKHGILGVWVREFAQAITKSNSC